MAHEERGYTIGDISEMYNLGRDSLRYYEERGILTPKRAANGYRLYSRTDIWRINVIVNLRNLGLSVNRIAEYFQDRSIDATVEMLMNELSELQRQEQELIEKQRQIAADLKVLMSAQKLKVGEVVHKTLEERRAFIIRRAYTRDEDMDLLMKELTELSGGDYQLIANNRFASVLAPEGADELFAAAALFDDEGDEVVEAGEYLSICYKAPDVGILKRCMQIIREYAEDNGFKIVGPFIELIWIDIHTAAQSEEHLSEIMCRVEKA